MGLVTLENFRAELVGTLGRDPGDPVTTRWINFGYQHLGTLIDFDVLDKNWSLSTVAGQYEYANTPLLASPTYYLGTKYIYNNDGDARLEWLPQAEFYDYADGVTGRPRYWATEGDNILLHPTPLVAESHKVVYKSAPVALSADGDMTVLSASLDLVIVYLAAAHAFSQLNEEDRAGFMEQKALAYIQTHVTEDKIQGIAGQMAAYPGDEFEQVPGGASR